MTRREVQRIADIAPGLLTRMYRIVAATDPRDLRYSADKITFSCDIKSAHAFRNESD